MRRKTIWIVAGIVAVAGAAAAIAQVGHREGRFGHRGMMNDMAELGLETDGEPGFGPGRGMGGMYEHGGHGRRGEMMGHHGMMMGHGGMDRDGGWRGMWGRGGRSMTQDDFDTRSRERFARLDKNSDGAIDAAEVEAAMAGQGGRGPQMGEAMSQRFLAMFDTNRDGKVTRDEFLARVRVEFGRADLNSDGRITDEDLPPMARGRNVLKGEGRMGPMMGGGMMGGGAMGGRGMMLGRLIEADANKDGVITLDEAMASATRRFEQLDRTKDGAVDKADFDALRKETADYRVQRFMHEYGADKDRKVTRDQFFGRAKERFAERDINRDGRLDRQDMMPGMGPDAGPGGPGRGRGMMDRGPMGPDGGGQMGPGAGQGPGPGPGGPGMRDRGPPR